MQSIAANHNTLRNVVTGFNLVLDTALFVWLLSVTFTGPQPLKVQAVVAALFAGVFAIGLVSGLVPGKRVALGTAITRLVLLAVLFLWPGLSFLALLFAPTTLAMLMLAAAARLGHQDEA